MTVLESSVLSYPERGPYGRSTFRGNTSGYVVRDLMETYHATSVFDPMAGSGTTLDVCRELDVPCFSYDLADGYDILNGRSQYQMRQHIAARVGEQGVDFVFFHPPYWNMISYSDDPHDFSNGSYGMYIQHMQDALKFIVSVMAPGGVIALQLADLRRMHRTWFLADDTTTPASLRSVKLVKEFRFIKLQHYTTTSGVSDYWVKFAHEYITILRKPS